MRFTIILLAALAILPLAFSKDVCGRHKFGYKAIDPENHHGFYVCLGRLGHYLNLCAQGFKFNESEQRCVVEAVGTCPCAQLGSNGLNGVPKYLFNLNQKVVIDHPVINSAFMLPLLPTSSNQQNPALSGSGKPCKDSNSTATTTPPPPVQSSTPCESARPSTPAQNSTTEASTPRLPANSTTTPSSPASTPSSEASTTPPPPSSTSNAPSNSTTEASPPPPSSSSEQPPAAGNSTSTTAAPPPSSTSNAPSNSTTEASPSPPSSSSEQPPAGGNSTSTSVSPPSSESSTESAPPQSSTPSQPSNSTEPQPTTAPSSSSEQPGTTPASPPNNSSSTEAPSANSTAPSTTPCPPLNIHLKPHIGKCDPIPPDCSSVPDGHLLRDSALCSKFYTCSQGRPIPQECSDGLYFDIKKNVCNFKSLVDCHNCAHLSVSTISKPKKPAKSLKHFVKKPSCRGKANGASIRDTKHCDKYYICRDEKPVTHFCSPGQWFDIKSSACNLKKFVACKV